MKLTLEIHITWTTFFSKWPVQPSSAAWYLKHPPILHHLVPPSPLVLHWHGWSPPRDGCPVWGRKPSSLSPSDGAQELGERLHCVQKALPSCPGHFKFYEGSCSWRRKGGEAGAKAKKFLNPPEIQIKQETRFARHSYSLTKTGDFQPLTWVSLAGPVCLPLIPTQLEELHAFVPSQLKRLSALSLLKKKKKKS